MINCDISKWPIVYMHFGSSPTYLDALDWLTNCSAILNKKEKFLVISTFSENYQFEHNARIQQAKWFKKARQDLSKYCLGMIRVTKDPIMIKKINAPAMEKGMPIKCIAVRDISEAEDKAHQITTKNNLT